MDYPSQYRYTTEHEWVAAEGNKARIGITDFAQQQLGDIVFVELPTVGAELTAGQAFGTIESVKAVSEVFSPVNGKVTAVNGELAASPEKVNQDPHTAAWLVEATLSDPAQLAKLMDKAAYEKFLAAQEPAESH